MIDKLQAELLKAHDSLQTIDFKLGSENFTFYHKYMTVFEKARIEQMCVKTVTTTNTDGSSNVTHKKQDHLIPIHTILEKALDKDGKRLFSHTNPEHFKLVSELPHGLASMIAYEMMIDITGTLKNG